MFQRAVSEGLPSKRERRYSQEAFDSNLPPLELMVRTKGLFNRTREAASARVARLVQGSWAGLIGCPGSRVGCGGVRAGGGSGCQGISYPPTVAGTKPPLISGRRPPLDAGRLGGYPKRAKTNPAAHMPQRLPKNRGSVHL